MFSSFIGWFINFGGISGDGGFTGGGGGTSGAF